MTLTFRNAMADDVDAVRQLFYDTVTTVNRQHYDDKQINAWSANYHNRQNWEDKVATQHFILAMDGNELVGFSSVTDDGYLDFMFVHHQRQGQGIASGLLTQIEAIARQQQLALLTTQASITAKPFFESHGFTVQKQQTATVREVALTNFVMEKQLNTEAAPIAAALSSLENI